MVIFLELCCAEKYLRFYNKWLTLKSKCSYPGKPLPFPPVPTLEELSSFRR